MLDSGHAVVRVGDGHGFVVHGNDESRYIITAAHCIFDNEDHRGLPRPHLARDLAEETYRNIMGPLGRKKAVWATLCFADPMSDSVLRAGQSGIGRRI